MCLQIGSTARTITRYDHLYHTTIGGLRIRRTHYEGVQTDEDVQRPDA